MLYKTKGIVISHIPYRETSIITKIYTEKFGIQTYIENGVRTMKGRNRMALFQPLTLLDLVVYHHHKKDIHRISEIKCNTPLITIPYDIRKSSVAIFLNEVLHKTLKEQVENESLFFFLYQSIISLDESKKGFENFHLIFLVKLSSFLGFAPQSTKELDEQLQEHHIQINISKEKSDMLNLILDGDFSTHLIFSKKDRNEMLDILLAFYRLHQDEFGELKSLKVLKEVLQN